jgi:hypothetical protein
MAKTSKDKDGGLVSACNGQECGRPGGPGTSQTFLNSVPPFSALFVYLLLVLASSRNSHWRIRVPSCFRRVRRCPRLRHGKAYLCSARWKSRIVIGVWLASLDSGPVRHDRTLIGGKRVCSGATIAQRSCQTTRFSPQMRFRCDSGWCCPPLKMTDDSPETLTSQDHAIWLRPR